MIECRLMPDKVKGRATDQSAGEYKMDNDQTGLDYETGLECALRVFENQKAVMAWVNRPNSTLADRRLIDVLATEQGY
jgi:uncharacterized protein (DUF2384 family)